MGKLLKLVVKNENVALTDKNILEQAMALTRELQDHVHQHGLQNTGQDWVELQLQLIENRLSDVLGKLDDAKRGPGPYKRDPSDHHFVKYLPGPSEIVTQPKGKKK
jgi:hypothetical protein